MSQASSQEINRLVLEELKRQRGVLSVSYEEISSEIKTHFTIWIESVGLPFSFTIPNMKLYYGSTNPREHTKIPQLNGSTQDT